MIAHLLILNRSIFSVYFTLRTQIPNTAIGDRDTSLDLCNVNFQHIKIVAKGKTLRIRVRVRLCKRAIQLYRVRIQTRLYLAAIKLYSSFNIQHEDLIKVPFDSKKLNSTHFSKKMRLMAMPL